MRIDQIRKENIKKYHDIEYILIDDFFDPELFETLHKKYLLEYTVIEKLEHHYVISGHYLLDLLHTDKDKILAAVNSVWQENCVENRTAVTLMTKDLKLPIHNDTHWENVPVRGILYLNGICGTTFYSDYKGSNPVIIGGKPNQLLLFKVSEHSYHSAGTETIDRGDRFVITMMFDRTQEQE